MFEPAILFQVHKIKSRIPKSSIEVHSLALNPIPPANGTVADIALDLWSDQDHREVNGLDLFNISEETSSCHRSLALSVEKEAWIRVFCGPLEYVVK